MRHLRASICHSGAPEPPPALVADLTDRHLQGPVPGNRWSESRAMRTSLFSFFLSPSLLHSPKKRWTAISAFCCCFQIKLFRETVLRPKPLDSDNCVEGASNYWLFSHRSVSYKRPATARYRASSVSVSLCDRSALGLQFFGRCQQHYQLSSAVYLPFLLSTLLSGLHFSLPGSKSQPPTRRTRI